MASDQEAIQGLWKVETMIHKGQNVGHSDTHWEFDRNRVRQIVPQFVNGGPWGMFLLDPTTDPKRIDTTYEQESHGGKPITRTHKRCYILDGDTLKIGGSVVFGRYPEAISDETSMVTTLSRYNGPRPETKKASGKPAMENSVLGMVMWNDDLDQWETVLDVGPTRKVGVFISPDGESDEKSILMAQEFVEWIRLHEQDAREYAAREMIETAEYWRDEDEYPAPMTEKSFAGRITLTEISVTSDRGANLWYDDDNIFAGHVVVVSVNPNREFTNAQMMG